MSDDLEHGDNLPADHASGDKGNHTVEGWNSVLDEAARIALVQVADDRGREVFQTAGTTPGWYRADGADGWLFMGKVDAAVFGADYQRVVALARTTTTDTAFPGTVKASLVTPAGLNGTYRVGWVAVVDNENAAAQTSVRLFNATAAAQIGATRVNEPDDLLDRATTSGFDEVVLAGAATTLQLEFITSAGGTAGMQDAQIEFWRVA